MSETVIRGRRHFPTHSSLCRYKRFDISNWMYHVHRRPK